MVVIAGYLPTFTTSAPSSTRQTTSKNGLLMTRFKCHHDTLLQKLDELGHDNRQAFLGFFEEYSAFPIDSVPMNDEGHSLLTSPEASA